MKSFKIVNLTKWRTDHLRAFCARAFKDELRDVTTNYSTKGPQPLVLRITFKPGRNQRGLAGGHASISGHGITVFVPARGVNKVDLAFTLTHEMAHARGLNHADMGAQYMCRDAEQLVTWYEWGESLPLEEQTVKRTKQPTAADKLQHAQLMLKRAQTRQKRATSIVTKWRKKVRYYEQRAAAVYAQAASPRQEHATDGQHIRPVHAGSV